MSVAGRNSLDLLRLVAATLVLYSHQYALTGQAEPSFFGWTTFGGAGVTIFFFLSGLLVCSSWVRDPDLKRFFVRRSLRIFPALWVVVLTSIFLLGPVFSNLSLADYFGLPQTWNYLSTALLVVRNVLPGVFVDNPYPLAVNGSLWTLPVEFLCYVSVAMLGCIKVTAKGVLIAASLLLFVLLASFAPVLSGATLTAHIGDLSYGTYMFAFPVQQMLVHWSQGLGWSFGVSFLLSLAVTSSFAFASWHLIEKRALLFKPHVRAAA